ncbi:MAG: serine protease [Verrucomicrobiota bacterium]|jgi:S1-C subfamily serine protease|nr:serine protease [Verrucomicrobiota bacterium]
MNWIKMATVAVAGLMFSGCASLSTQNPPAASQAEPVVINDRQIIRQMTAKASRMMDSDSVVGMKTLIERLKKEPKVNLRLPKTGSASADEARKAVAVVGGVYKCDKCTRWHVAPASGFLIAEDLVVTNYHVVDNPERSGLAVRLFDGRVFMVEDVVASSEQYDLVVLRLPKTGIKPIALGQAAPVGAKVDLISHPNHKFYTLSEGRVARYFVTQRNRRPVPAMAITADFGKGSSGAPVLNEDGQVVGVAASTESLYYTEKDGEQKNLQMVFKNCVPVSQLRELIGG